MRSLQANQQGAAQSAPRMDTFPQVLLSELPVGVLVMGAQGEIRFTNQAALDLLDLTADQMLDQTPLDPAWHVIQENGTPFQMKLHTAPVRAKQALLLLSTRQSLRKLVLGVYRPTKRDRVWISVNTEPQLDADGCVEQVVCTLSEITNHKASEQLSKINECFSGLGSDPDENINRITAYAGELLGGAWAVYNRLHQGLLWSWGQWRTPPEFSNVGDPDGHLCHDVIQQGSDQTYVVQDLPNTSYAQSDPWVIPYQLQSYIGQAIRCAGEYIGSLCVVYQNQFVPTESDKKLMGIMAAAIGVEEERKKEAVVWAQNEGKWRSLLQNSSNLITILEADGTIKYASPAIEGILGYKPKELIGKNTFDLVHPEDVSLVRSDFQGVLENSTTTLSIEFRFQHQDGSWRYIEATHSNLVMDAPGVRIVVNSRDITDRKRAEAALIQSEAQLREKADQLEQALHELQQTQSQLVQTEKMSSLGQLVAGVAHEINNPVSFIYGNLPYATEYTQDLLRLVHLYQQEYPEPTPAIQEVAEGLDIDFLSEDLPKLMNSMLVGAERIRQIVLSLRNFSRLDKAAREPFDLHNGIDNTLLLLQHRLKPKAGRTEIQILKEYDNLPRVDCYAGQINQVFMNILSNSIDALEESIVNGQWSVVSRKTTDIPTIRIRTELANDNKVVIRITDNGPGIPSEVQQHIFDPFFTTKPVGQGTGLGLSISYQVVVEKHGGVLKCQSAPGEGTEFCIELPVNLPQPEGA